MQEIRVLVMGGRPTPHLIGVISQFPSKIEFVISQDSRNHYKTIGEALAGFAEIEIADKPYFVSAYDMAETEKACRAIASLHPNAPLTFDVTSAPKLMSIAAYDVARDLQQRAIFVDTTNSRIVNLTPRSSQQTVLIQIKLDDYLACYGRRAEEKFSFDRLSCSQEQAIALAHYFATGGIRVMHTLNEVRKWVEGKDKRTIPFSKTKPLEASGFEVLESAEQFGIVSNLQQREDKRVAFTIQNTMDGKYLEGSWLEVFVWDAARNAKLPDDITLFDDCRLSVEIPSDEVRKEIDVACMRGGQLILASCKTEAKPFKTDALDELRTVSSLVGGKFTSRLFITNAFPPDPNDSGAYPDYEKFLKQARDREIIVVTGNDLPSIAAILQREALTPTYARI